MNRCVACGHRVKDEELSGGTCTVCREAGVVALTLEGTDG